MTPEADIIATRYTKSVIKSAAALSYVEAQARMDDRYAIISPQILCVNVDKIFFNLALLNLILKEKK